MLNVSVSFLNKLDVYHKEQEKEILTMLFYFIFVDLLSISAMKMLKALSLF